jgi:hypothetical protein
MLGARFKAWRMNFGKGWRVVTVDEMGKDVGTTTVEEAQRRGL